MPITRPPVWIVSLLVLGFLVRPAAAEDASASDGHRVDIFVGLGISFPSDSTRTGDGKGAFLEGAYVFWPHSAVTPRLYGGLLATTPDRKTCSAVPCDVEAQIAFAGAKVRVMAPIPWVAPYLELGLGVSAGHLRTLDGTMIDTKTWGLTWHYPIALGVAFGVRHQYDVSFSYLFHPEEQQVEGAFAIGFGFAVP